MLERVWRPARQKPKLSAMFSISQRTLCKLVCFLETEERTNYRVLRFSSGCVPGKATPKKALFSLPPIAMREEPEEMGSSRHSYS